MFKKYHQAYIFHNSTEFSKKNTNKNSFFKKSKMDVLDSNRDVQFLHNYNKDLKLTLLEYLEIQETLTNNTMNCVNEIHQFCLLYNNLHYDYI